MPHFVKRLLKALKALNVVYNGNYDILTINNTENEMVKAILFDFGGVIYKHPKAVIPQVLSVIFNQPEEKIGKEYGKYKNQFFAGKISSEKLLDSLKQKFSTKKTIEELEKEWLRVYGELARPDEGILSLLNDLKGKYKLYLFTNTTKMSDRHNRRTGIYNYFDDLFCSFKIGLVKPDPKIYQFAISKIGIKPEECILIDDLEENLSPARNLGIKTLLFDVLKENPKKLGIELKKLGVTS